MPDASPARAPFVPLDDLTAEQVIARIDNARGHIATSTSDDPSVLTAYVATVANLLILDRIERNAPAWAAAEIGQLEPDDEPEPDPTADHARLVASYQAAWRRETTEAARYRAIADMPGSDAVAAMTAERHDREAAGYAAALRALGADVPGAAPAASTGRTGPAVTGGPSDDELVDALTDTGDGAVVMFANGDARIPVVVARIRRLLDVYGRHSTNDAIDMLAAFLSDDGRFEAFGEVAAGEGAAGMAIRLLIDHRVADIRSDGPTLAAGLRQAAAIIAQCDPPGVEGAESARACRLTAELLDPQDR